MSLAANLGLGRRKSGCVCAIGVWRRRTKDEAPSVASCGTAGGALHHETFFHNPQFELVLEGAAQQRLEIKLDHVMIDKAVPGKEPCVGFVVLSASASGRRRKTFGTPGGAFGYSAICAVCPPTFTHGGDAFAWLKLERLSSPYIIVPCTLDPGHEGIFALRVRSNFGVRLRPLPSKALDDIRSEAALEDEFELDRSTKGETDSEPAHTRPLDSETPATTTDAAVDRVLRSLRGHDGPFKDEAVETLLAPPSTAPRLVRWRRPSQLQWQQEGQPSLPFGVSHTPVFLSPAPKVPTDLPSWGDSTAPSGPLSADDLAAGSWLLGALAVVAQRPQLVDHCFVHGSHSQRGVLAVRFWDWNRWRTVVTDDRLATAGGRILYGACEEEADLRFAFLIKAYAALHGSFAALGSGRVAEALVDLTGGLSHTIEIAAYESASAETRSQQLELLWHELAELQSSGALLSCGQDAEKQGGRAQTLGVRPRSTYALLQLLQMGAHRLVCVRNPWGTPAFSGRWSSGAVEWIAPQRDGRWPIEMLQAQQSPHAFAAVASAGTGVTWMDWADFLEFFDRIYACRLPSPEQPFKVLHGKWDLESSGGCLNHLTSWRRNPQLLLDLPRGGRLCLCLSQPRRSGSVRERAHAAIGVCVLRGDGRRRLLASPRLLGASSITDAREVSLSITLPPSDAHAPHVLVPYTFEPGELGPFRLSVWASVPFGVSPLSRANEWEHVCADGQWDASSGGVPNAGNDYWRNPQWELAPTPQPVVLRIVLEVHPAPAAGEARELTIGCLLLRGDVGGDDAGGIQQDDVLAQAGFATAAQVSCSLTLPASTKPRRLLACTFHPGQQATFQLHLYSDKPLKLTALPFGPTSGTGLGHAAGPRPEHSSGAYPDPSAAVGPSTFLIDPSIGPDADTTASYLHNEVKNLRSELQAVQDLLAKNAVQDAEHEAAKQHRNSTPFRKVARFLSGRQH